MTTVNKSMFPLQTGFSVISKMQGKFATLQMQLGTGTKAQTLSEMGRDLPVSLSVRSRLTTIAGYNASIEQVDLRMSFYDNALTRLDAIGHRQAIRLEQRLGLMLVDVH